MAKFVKILSYDDMFDSTLSKDVRRKHIDNIDIVSVANIGNRSIHSLWMDKTDRNKKHTSKETKWDKIIVSVIMDEVSKEYNLGINRGGYVQSLDNDIIGSIVHGFIEGEDAGITCLSRIVQDGWEDECVPMAEYVNSQWCMAATGYDHWYVACLVDETNLITRIVDRDEDAISNLIKEAETFLNIYVKKDKVPDVTDSVYCTEAIADKYLRSNPSLKLKVIEEGEYDTLCGDIIKMRSDISRQKKILDMMLNKLKLKMEFSEHGGTLNYKIYWGTKASRVFDEDRFKEDYPEVYDRYLILEFRRPVIIKPYSTNPMSIKAREKRRDETLRNQRLSE